MNDIFLTLTLQTLETLFGEEYSESTITLYLFYYKTAKYQGTNQPWSTVSFCSKGLGWSESKVRRAKKILRNVGLIEDIPAIGAHGKAYVKLNFITSEKTTNSVFNSGQSKSGIPNSKGQMLKENKECLKNINSFSKEKERTPSGGSSSKKVNLVKKKKVNPVKKKTEPVNPVKRKTPIQTALKNRKKNYPEKSKIKSKPKQKKYTLRDKQTYNALVELGATKHRLDTNQYIYTMNAINELLSPCKNPFSYIDSYPDDLVNNKYTDDDLIKAYEFHLKFCKETNKNPVKSISTFIVLKGWNGTKHFSPFLNSIKNMKSYDYKEVNGELKVLMKECNSININFNAMQARRVMMMLTEKTKSYSTPSGLDSLYFGKPYYVFIEYLKNRNGRKPIHENIVASETFIDGFIKDALSKKILIKGNRRYAY